MKKYLLLLLTGCLIVSPASHADKAFAERFNTYLQLNQNLPTSPTAELIQFISPDRPLSNKLRERWLNQLALQKNWADFVQYYRPSQDKTLQCYEALADYNTGKQAAGLAKAKALWLEGDSQPKACDALFSLLLKDSQHDEKLITQRIILALDKRNFALARYLLKQYQPPRLNEIPILINVYQNPGAITRLEPSELHQAFYLYGLKRMVANNMDKAIQFWQHVKNRKFLSQARQQAFLAHVALYKAMRGQEDAAAWFAKVKPAYYNDVLLDWEIRSALKNHQWAKVETLINALKTKDEPCWQYWKARALEAQGKKADAMLIYNELAKTRHYYGFLSSIRLKKPLQFVNEKPVMDLDKLKDYSDILAKIKRLYELKDTGQASRLLNDLSSELPTDEASALSWWVANDLNWPDKAVYLSSKIEGLNNQLDLRFPLAYQGTVNTYAQTYTVPPEFVYAIIRQESGFRPDIVSTAGARGLMQLMPRTAKTIASQQKISYHNQEELFQAKENINIGTAYLAHLAKRYHHHPILIAAAYNAGPHQVAYWLRNHNPKAIDIWIETLPWHETRNYLKNIIAFFAVYQYRMKQKPDLNYFMQPIN